MTGPRLNARLSNLRHPNSSIETSIRSHPLNSSVQLLFPEAASSSAPRPAPPSIPGEDACCLLSCQLGDLIAELVGHGFFRQPGLVFQAIAVDSDLDHGNSLAITPDGKLHFAVSKDVYHQLGLVGTSSSTTPGERYNVCVHLMGKSFKPDSHHYSRVIQCLNEKLSPALLLCRCERDGASAVAELSRLPCTVTPPSFYKPAALMRSENAGEGTIDVLALTRCALDACCGHDDGAVLLLPALHEWLSALACGWSGTAVNELLPSWDLAACPATVNATTWRGLLSSQQVLSCLSYAIELVKTGQAPWAYLSAWGFADSPVAWGDAEHSTAPWGGGGAESQYSVLLMPDGDYCIFTPFGGS